MFCDTLIKVWGVFEIPGHPELIVLITYKRSGYCDEWDLPVVIPGV
jgi:hypothetical protein